MLTYIIAGKIYHDQSNGETRRSISCGKWEWWGCAGVYEGHWLNQLVQEHEGNFGISHAFGLCRYGASHDREAAESSQWDRVVMEEPEHGKYLFYSTIVKYIVVPSLINDLLFFIDVWIDVW